MTTPDGISMDEAALISTFLEALLYGFSLVLFGWTFWVLVRRRAAVSINYKILVVACLLLIFSTAHFAIDMQRVIDGLVTERGSFPGGPVAYFSQISMPSFVTKSVLYMLQTLVGDGVVIYRCHVVWRSIPLSLFLFMLWCSIAVAGVMIAFLSSASSSGTAQVFDMSLGKWIAAFYAMTFATNLVSTALLSYRLWVADRKAASIRVNRSQLIPIMRVVLDAGVIYSLTLVVALGCYLGHSNTEFVVLDMIMPVISITFYMAIIRIGMAQAKKTTSTSFALEGTSSSLSRREGSRTTNRARNMQVHITTLTECKGDDPRLFREESDTADVKIVNGGGV
ncbi:hypothetical protein HYDPIDRAFT_30590 [Hydnomerulius pinastri MD-312]|uniref:Uncharacterized protein n=1 Tax=Hydnomerulius pinastri MD-312 TaxID=994086 RepID=A0A0C9VVZ8_9AGAM|nr:hypothetical protein HYDPIDRAFT_30590 [Hydnomerulius pinastri MD-312]